MMLGSPSFKDGMGFFTGMNIDTEFFSLNEGLQVVRKELGEERYAALRTMSDEMRALFDSDPDETNGGTKAGRKIIRDMEHILKAAISRRKSE